MVSLVFTPAGSGSQPPPPKRDILPQTTLGYMKAARRWLLWKYGNISVPGKKPPKVPYYVDGALRGDTDTLEDLARLSEYEAAHRAAQRSGGVMHLGFALGADGGNGHWQGFDSDGTLDGMAEAPGYVEKSPSGQGYHIIGYGRPFATRAEPGIEFYSHGRYFTFTGDQVHDGPVHDLYDMAGTGPPPAKDLEGAPPRHVDELSQEQLADVKEALSVLSPDPYAEWVRVALALQSVSGGLELFLNWSRGSAKHKDGEATRKFEKVGAPFTHWKAIFVWAKETGNWPKAAPAASQPINYDTSAPRPMEFVLDGFVRAGSLVLAGAPGVGKSSIVVPLAATVAWLTDMKELRPVLRRRVYYVTEDHEQVVRMLRGMRLMKILTAPDGEMREWFRIIPSVRTSPKAWQLSLTEMLRDAAHDQEFAGGLSYKVEPLVVLDTVAANLDLADENDNAAVGRAVAAVRAGVGPASVWMVAHTAKALKRADPDEMSPRGAGAWVGDTQGEAFIFTDDEQPEHRFIRLGKRRFDADFEEMRVASKLEEEKVQAPWGEQLVRYRVAHAFERYSKEARKEVKESAAGDRQQGDVQARTMMMLSRAKKALEACRSEGLALPKRAGRADPPAGYERWSLDGLLSGGRSPEARAHLLAQLVDKFGGTDDGTGAFWLFKKPTFGVGAKKAPAEGEEAKP